MMTTGGPSDPGRPPRFYPGGNPGRVRGLRLGGGARPPREQVISPDAAMAVPSTSPVTGGIKMAATATKPPLGSGARFHNLVGQLSKKPGVTDPKKLAAFIGQKKYGAGKMSSMAAHNRGK